MWERGREKNAFSLRLLLHRILLPQLFSCFRALRTSKQQRRAAVYRVRINKKCELRWGGVFWSRNSSSSREAWSRKAAAQQKRRKLAQEIHIILRFSRLFSVHLHETLILRLSSMAPLRNQGFIALHVSSRPSNSGRTLNDNMLVVTFDAETTEASEVVAISAWRMVSPSSSHITFAAGCEPHVSHLMNATRPVDKISFGVTISTFKGFTVILIIIQHEREVGEWKREKRGFQWNEKNWLWTTCCVLGAGWLSGDDS